MALGPTRNCLMPLSSDSEQGLPIRGQATLTRFLPRQISPGQCRAARGMMNWSIGRLSRESEVPVAEITALELGRRQTRAATLGSLIRAFARGGIQFLPNDGLRLLDLPSDDRSLPFNPD